MELSDGRIITLVEDARLPLDSFVTTFGDKIFQTNHVNNSVTCYTINGEKFLVYVYGVWTAHSVVLVQ
jgi:hypothetical protein